MFNSCWRGRSSATERNSGHGARAHHQRWPSPVWADMFDRKASDAFALEDEISTAIAAAVSPRLSG